MENECGKKVWIGRVLSVLGALPFIFSAAMKFTGSPQLVEGMAHFGWPAEMLRTLAILEASCVILYLIPPVSVFGAILLTGFLGGAVATHLRIGEPVYLHVVIGFLIWGGLFLREPKLRQLVPVRSKSFKYEREILVNRPPETVFAYLKPLKNFQAWNPFLRKDPQVKTEYRGQDGQVGVTSSWEGNRDVGSGEQEVTKIVEGRRIEFELRFKKPFKATNQGYFAAEPAGAGQTKVRWGMTGETVFPMNVICAFIGMEKMMAKEFDAGLKQLKVNLEK